MTTRHFYLTETTDPFRGSKEQTTILLIPVRLCVCLTQILAFHIIRFLSSLSHSKEHVSFVS